MGARRLGAAGVILCLTALPATAKIKIAFVGDSTADGMWGGVIRLVSRDSCLKDNFELLRLAKNGTGLTRADKLNWVTETAKINQAQKPELFVISLGLNDRQSVVEPGHVTAYESPNYGDHYRERVSEMIKAATADGAGVIWLTLAAMREAPADKDAVAKNKLFAAAVQSAANSAVEFIDRRKFDVVGGDTFASYAPDKSGTRINIRTADGEHFTGVGEEIAAAEVLPRILANLKARNIPGAMACQK